MRKHTKRVLVLSLGVAFVVLGLVGLVLPFLQGFLFLAIGLLLLSLYSPTIRAWMDKHTVKYPKLHTMVAKAEEWIVKVIGRP